MDLKSCNSSVEEKAAKDKKPEGLKTRLSAGAIWFSSYFSVQNTSPSCSHANIKKINYLHQLLWIPRSLWAANGGVRRSSVEDPSRAQRGKICVLLILLKLVWGLKPTERPATGKVIAKKWARAPFGPELRVGSQAWRVLQRKRWSQNEIFFPLIPNNVIPTPHPQRYILKIVCVCMCTHVCICECRYPRSLG